MFMGEEEMEMLKVSPPKHIAEICESRVQRLWTAGHGIAKVLKPKSIERIVDRPVESHETDEGDEEGLYFQRCK